MILLEFILTACCCVLSYSPSPQQGQQPGDDLKSRTSFLSRAFFFWFTPTVLTGWARPLVFEDMISFDKEDGAERVRLRTAKTTWLERGAL